MPRQKERGPPTRKSQRLATKAPEEPIDETAIDETSAQASAPIEERSNDEATLDSIEYDPAEEHHSATDIGPDSAAGEPRERENSDTPFQTPVIMASSEGRTVNQLDALLSRIAQLENIIRNGQASNTQGDGLDAGRRDRDVTPANSAFGGNDFQPTGFAALPAFKPFGDDQNAANPDYDRKARKTGADPGVFEGDKAGFDDWIIQVADKFDEDLETFKRERSRMAVLQSLVGGTAKSLIAGRYRSTEMPFRNAAEMVATLSAVYHDHNQGTKAREELRKLQYDITDTTMDIHQFISTVNSLADTANVARTERKTVLYEHIPADLDPRLLGDAADELIPYETFARNVANAVLAKQRAYQQRREKKEDKRARESQEDRRAEHPRRRRTPAKKEAKVAPMETTQLSGEAVEELKKEGKCFLCQKKGHIVKTCPQRRQSIAVLLAALEKESEDSEGDSSSETSTSSDESKN